MEASPLLLAATDHGVTEHIDKASSSSDQAFNSKDTQEEESKEK